MIFATISGASFLLHDISMEVFSGSVVKHLHGVRAGTGLDICPDISHLSLPIVHTGSL